MKHFFLYSAFLITIFTNNTIAQKNTEIKNVYTAHNKGKIFISWGGNRETYSKSDITFRGKDYHFTLENVEAHDKPKGWHVDYINPIRMTIPGCYFVTACFCLTLF